MVFHVLNRGVGRRTLFDKDADFLAFERVIEETLRTCPMRICAYCLLSNHWHFVVWPERDGQLQAFMQRMTNRHAKRWKQYLHETGDVWSSLRRAEREDPKSPILSPWPLPRPTDWLDIVNQPQTDAELEAVRRCVTRGCPLGGPDWVARTAKQLCLESTLRPRGRPRDSR